MDLEEQIKEVKKQFYCIITNHICI